MKSKTTIEVNGKRYDAITGEILGVASAPPVRTGRNIDGFFRARQTPAVSRVVPPASDSITVLAAPAPSPKPHRRPPSRTVNHAHAHAPQAAHVRVHDAPSAHQSQSITVHHTPAAVNHTKPHVTQTSRTLRREGVQRPTPSFHKQAGTVGTLQHAVPSLIVPKQSAVTVDPGRLVRAQSVHRSPQISRHGQKSGLHPTLAPLTVQAPPPQPNNSGDPIPAPQPPANDPKPDIFTQALMNAEHYVDVHAHVKHFKKQTKRHLASMAAGTLALVVIAGFAAYQNTPGLQFKVASIQAGVSTGMPNLKAAGFAYTGVRAGNGKLTVGFKDGTGNYQLTQQTTNLSSTDVIHNISATDAGGNPNYVTIQAGNTTVYRFANTDATWVSDGQWYTVNGNSPLTDRQVQSLVKNI